MKELKAWECSDGKRFFDKEEAEEHQKTVVCEHKNIVKYKKWDAPICDDCGKVFGGWFCPDSPDHACHYFTEGGKVELNTGEWAVPNPEHWEDGKEYETDDRCLFCGDPEERK